MNTAEKIGLLPGFGWIAGHGFWVTALMCLALTPGAMILIAPVFESRALPLLPDKQFVSFFPGDLFLGMMAAGLLVLAQGLPSQERWYNSLWFHLVVLVVVIAVAVFMTYAEWKGGVYPTRAIFSPTKLYHNLLLYGGYGYVIVTTLFAVCAGSAWNWGFSGLLIAALIPGLIWGGLVVMDNSLGSEESKAKASHAHVEDWKPIWA